MPHPVMSWHTLYPTVPASAWVAEAPVIWHRTIPEKLVQCLWFDQRWRPSTLRTLDGREVIVHSPGRWNLQAGPDFQQASIAFVDGIRHRGDVEIHLYASGWAAHRHHLDTRYNNVILHVFLWNDRQAPEVRRADGQLVPQVALEQFLPRPLVTYQADIVLEDYPYKTAHVHGRCYETLQQLAPQEVCEVLDRAGDTRLQQRVWRWSRREGEVGLTQVMYEAVLRALGSTGHRQHFQALARTVSWDALQCCLGSIPLQERGLAAEALLLGIAGMLPYDTCMYGTMDAETRQYVMALQNYWHTFPADIQQCAWHDMNWRQPNVRPANTPERRLAGMAQILAQYHGASLFDAAVALCHTRYRERAVRPARGCDRLPSAASCRKRQLLLKSFNRFDQLAKRVQPLGFLPNAIPHEVVPIPIEVGAAHVQHRLSTLDGPAHPRTLHPVLNKMATRSLDNPRGEGIARREIDIVTHAMRIVVEVATNRGQLCPLLAS